VPTPAENPITEEKRLLGKVLFWDEQLSSDNTIACGSCHDPGHAGMDARIGINPGLDELFDTIDDVAGSPGMVSRDADGVALDHPLFGRDAQITRRATNPMINAAYAPELFWDGRAGGQFLNPEDGTLSIPFGAALENQAIAPILSDVEMAQASRTWMDVTGKLLAATPLQFAGDLPADLSAALISEPSYSDLFADAFGDGTITAERIAFAIATYERTLIADDTPWDRFVAGDTDALTLTQAQGFNTILITSCGSCHIPPAFTDQTFRNIGVRPLTEDAGRFEVTGNPADRGRFKVPTLRNVGLKTTFMHDGSLTSLDEVVSFYALGNQNSQQNIDPLMPVTVQETQVAALVDFLQNGLTDARVAAETYPFDHPRLLEGQDPREMIEFDDQSVLSWPAPLGAISYNIYRGLLSSLSSRDYGSCITGSDPNSADTTFTDASIPPSGDGFFYLKTVVDASSESALGNASDGSVRVPGTACP
jgi:cytochrome c peroxidase